jgi:hypothetical protein
MERTGSNHVLPDLEKLSLELGREPDVDDLDDDGWMASNKAERIIELGTLGEGAGGAVTKCMLKGGKTVFALKVGNGSRGIMTDGYADEGMTDYHHRSRSGYAEADPKGTRFQPET